MIHLFYYQFAVGMLRSHTVIIISNRKFTWKVEYLYLSNDMKLILRFNLLCYVYVIGLKTKFTSSGKKVILVL